MNNQGNGSVLGVLSGNTSVKFEVSFSTSTILYIGLAVLVAVAAGVIIGKKV